jgi:hypothetical protein
VLQTKLIGTAMEILAEVFNAVDRRTEQSKVVSELVRVFMRKASTVAKVQRLPLLIPN